MGVVFLSFVFFIYVGVMILGGLFDAQGSDTGYLVTLTQFDIFRESQVDLLGFNFTFPVPNLDWFKAVGNAIIWNSSIFEGYANYFRVAFLSSLAFGIVASIIISLFGNRLSK